MDMLSINTAFTRNIASFFLSKFIKKKFGYDVTVDLRELDVSHAKDDDVRIKLNLYAKISEEEYKHIIADVKRSI